MGDEKFVQGEDLAAYRVPDSGKCWWCGSDADTREHKFKQSVIKKMETAGGPLVWGNGNELRGVRSVRKSSQVKFKANLCSPCNNVRSQPFDVAFERFVDHVWARGDDLWAEPSIDMREIYGPVWPTQVLHLARYVVKLIGCRMDNDGYPVPAEFATFLDGGQLLSNVQMVTFKDPQIWELHKRIREESGQPVGLWMGPGMGMVSPSRKILTAYSSSLTIGYVGFFYRWDADVPETDPFYRYRRARLHRRDELPLM